MARKKRGVAPAFKKSYLPEDPGKIKKGKTREEKAEEARRLREERIRKAMDSAKKAVESGNSSLIEKAKISLTLLLTDRSVPERKRKEVIEQIDNIDRILAKPVQRKEPKKAQSKKSIEKKPKARQERREELLEELYPSIEFKKRKGRKIKEIDLLETEGLSAEQLARIIEDELNKERAKIADAKTEEAKKIAARKAELLREELDFVYEQANAYPKPISTIHEKGAPLPLLARLFRTFKGGKKEEVKKKTGIKYVTEKFENKVINQRNDSSLRRKVKQLISIRGEEKEIKKSRKKYR